MTIKALFAAAAVSSIFAAGAAFAEDYNKSPNSSLNQTPAQSSTQSTVSTDSTARSHYESTVQAQGDQLDVTAQTAETATAANVAATVEDSSAAPSVTTQVIASAPVPDTPANRARFGQPLSRAGKMTAPRGN
jgi:cytoskeletal protein RodZ